VFTERTAEGQLPQTIVKPFNKLNHKRSFSSSQIYELKKLLENNRPKKPRAQSRVLSNYDSQSDARNFVIVLINLSNGVESPTEMNS